MSNLDEIRARVEAASTGPWIVETGPWSGDNWLVGSVMCGKSRDSKDYYCHITTDHVHASELRGDAKTDAEFMAHAHSDIVYLLRLLDKLTTTV